MYALRLRSPHTNPRIFVKPLHLDMTYIVVPRRFHELLGNEINDVVVLEDPIGNTFNVPYYYIQGQCRIGAGFFGLRSIHQIETRLLIHFLYVGHAKFNIRIYDHFSREINYRLPPVFQPPVIPYNYESDSSHSESDEEVHPAPWMEMIWQANITAAHILGNQPMTISSQVQKRYFPNLPELISVLLPDNSIIQWHITWYPPRHVNPNAPFSGGRIGEFAAGCCDFYRDDFINLRNTNTVHRIELWELSDSDIFMVDVYTVQYH